MVFCSPSLMLSSSAPLSLSLCYIDPPLAIFSGTTAFPIPRPLPTALGCKSFPPEHSNTFRVSVREVFVGFFPCFIFPDWLYNFSLSPAFALFSSLFFNASPCQAPSPFFIKTCAGGWRLVRCTLFLILLTGILTLVPWLSPSDGKRPSILLMGSSFFPPCD